MSRPSETALRRPPLDPVAGREARHLHPADEVATDDAELGGRRRRWPWIAGLAVAVIAVVALLAGGDEPAPAGGPGGARAPIPVRAAAVERGTLDLVGRYPGELVGEVVELAPKVSGRLASVAVRPGDIVAAGDVVAVIDDADLRRELEATQGQLAVARAARQRAEAVVAAADSSFRRGEELHREELLSPQELDRLRSVAGSARADVASADAQIAQASAQVAQLRLQLADTRVTAPFAAIVAERHLDAGAMVQASTPVVRLVERGSLLVQFRVPESDLGRITAGDPFTVTTQATGDATFRGEVARIAGSVSRRDRTALVEGTLAEPPPTLRDGMYASVAVRLDQLEDQLLVPGVAVVERVEADGEGRTGVFVPVAAGEETQAEWRPVEVLGREGDAVAIDGAVAVGDPVLTLGHEELAAGATIQVVAATDAGAETSGEGAAR